MVSGVVLAVTLVSGSTSGSILKASKPKSAAFRFTDHLVIDGMDTQSDWAGSTETEFNFEKSVVGDISSYTRAVIEVSASNNAHIALAEYVSNDSLMYEICFGSEQNSRSYIRSSYDQVTQ